jgi:small-conductance mechanosensitive channel
VPWERIAVAAAVIFVTAIAARLADRRMARRKLDPQTATRYGVVRRSVSATIVAVGVLSALLAVPAVRAVAGGILASTAVVGIVVGFAAQRTLSNFLAGILIAFTHPLRLGDRVEVAGQTGDVEEVGLTYTFIRLADRSRLVIPNDKLASDTIRNSTIVSPESLAEITVHVPLTQDLGAIVELLREETGGEVAVTALNGDATVAVRVDAADEASAERLEHDLRLRVHARLRAAGIWP